MKSKRQNHVHKSVEVFNQILLQKIYLTDFLQYRPDDKINNGMKTSITAHRFVLCKAPITNS